MKRFSIKNILQTFLFVIALLLFTYIYYGNILNSFMDKKHNAITFMTLSEIQDIRGGCEGYGTCTPLNSCEYGEEDCREEVEEFCDNGTSFDCYQGSEITICTCPVHQVSIPGYSCD